MTGKRLLLLVLLQSPWAAAQQGAWEAIPLPVITVTATRGEREIYDLPESVSVLEDEALAREQPADLSDLLLELPNVDILGGPRSVGQRAVIRGIGDDRILFLLDGARQNFTRGHNARVYLEPDLLKRVEVVREPASALWGSGAIGGVVSLTTVDPEDLLLPGKRFGARLKGGVQTASRQGLGSAAVYGLIGERFDYLFNFTFRGAEDIRLGRGRLAHSGFDALAGLAKLAFRPNEANTLRFTTQTLDQTQQVPSNPQSQVAGDNRLVERATESRNFTFNWRFEPETS